MSELPKGWTTVALGDVIELRYGKALPKKHRNAGDFPVYGSAGVVDFHAEPLVSEPALVIGRKGSIGHVYPANCPFWPIDTTYFSRHDLKRVDLRWLYHRLQSVGLESMNKSAAVPGLNREDVYRLRTPLPPLDEQRRIAAILDKTAALRRQTQRAYKCAEGAYSSIFFQMFGEPLSNPQAFEIRPLQDVVSIASGGTPSKNNRKYWNGGIPWFSAKDFRDSRLTRSTDTVSPTALEETSLKRFSTETPVLVVRGMILARHLPIAQLGVPATINQDVKALVPKGPQNGVNLRFLTENLRAQRPYIMSLVSRAAHGTTRLETRHLETLPILRPGFEAEREFARRIEHAERHTTLRKVQYQHFCSLSQSLQYRAFRGEL